VFSLERRPFALGFFRGGGLLGFLRLLSGRFLIRKAGQANRRGAHRRRLLWRALVLWLIFLRLIRGLFAFFGVAPAWLRGLIRGRFRLGFVAWLLLLGRRRLFGVLRAFGRGLLLRRRELSELFLVFLVVLGDFRLGYLGREFILELGEVGLEVLE